MKVTKQT